MNDLTRTLADIGGHRYVATGLNDPERSEIDYLKVSPGPNLWSEIGPDDFGTEFDYETYDHGDTTVFYPVSNAALQWCYAFLPEDCPRWHGLGFVIETVYIKLVLQKAHDDKLVFLGDVMAEDEEIREQW